MSDHTLSWLHTHSQRLFPCRQGEFPSNRRCIEKYVRERGMRILSPMQIAAVIDAVKIRETAEEGPGSSWDRRFHEDEAGRTESD